MPAPSPGKLPDVLVGRYALYKRGTRKLVGWLTETAGQSCNLKDHVKSLRESLHTKSSKRRTGPTECEIRPTELVKLAEIISKAEHAADLPDDMLSLAKNVIDGREQCAQWYSTQSLVKGSKVEKENETHRFFIMILRRIVDILTGTSKKRAALDGEPQRVSTKAAKKGDKSSSTTTSALENLFETLELEEPNQNPLGGEPMAPSAKTNESWSKINFKLEKGEDETGFEMRCFLQDLADIREYVKHTWKEYKEGDLSFMTASLITDTAIGLLRRADDNFCAKDGKSRSTDYLKLLEHLGLEVFKHGRHVYMRPDPRRQTAEPRLPDSAINIVDLLCPIAYMCHVAYEKDARAACRVHPPEELPSKVQNRRDHIGDGFIEGLGEIHLSGQIRLWMVSACQTNLDIDEILGPEHISNGVTPLVECSDRIATLVRDANSLSFQSKDIQETAKAREALELYQRFLSKIHFVRCNEAQRDASATGKPASALEGYLPVFAGTQLADIKLRMYHVAKTVADHGTFVLTVAHLYKSLRATGALQTDWHDMAFVLSAFGKRRALVQQSGKVFSGEQAWRHFMLALGHRLQDLPAGANPAAGLRSRATLPPRKVVTTSALLQALADRAHFRYNNRAAHSRNEIVTAVLHAIADGDEVTVQAKSAACRAPNVRGYTKIQLLNAMKAKLIQDEQIINFDFAGFALSCKTLLCELSASLGHRVSSTTLQGDGLHRGLVGRIIYYAGDNTMTSSVAEFLRFHAASQGNMYTKRAFDQSSGRIPKHLRPKFKTADIPDQMWDDIFKSMYGGTETVYASSGPAVAVYHPRLDPAQSSSCAVPDCPVHCKNLSDPTLNDDQSEEFAAESVMPRAMLDEMRSNMAKDPEKTAENYYDLTYYIAKRWRALDMSPAKLRRMSLSMTGMDLKQVGPDEHGMEWVYYRPDPAKAREIGYFSRKAGEYYTQKARERGASGLALRMAILPDEVPMHVFVSQRVLDAEKRAREQSV